jgi:hypothetical protein
MPDDVKPAESAREGPEPLRLMVRTDGTDAWLVNEAGERVVFDAHARLELNVGPDHSRAHLTLVFPSLEVEHEGEGPAAPTSLLGYPCGGLRQGPPPPAEETTRRLGAAPAGGAGREAQSVGGRRLPTPEEARAYNDSQNQRRRR